MKFRGAGEWFLLHLDFFPFMVSSSGEFWLRKVKSLRQCLKPAFSLKANRELHPIVQIHSLVAQKILDGDSQNAELKASELVSTQGKNLQALPL